MQLSDDLRQVAAITIKGHPEPGGSKVAIPLKRGGAYLHDKTGRPITQIVDANSNVKKWRREVAKQAAEQYEGPLLDVPLVVMMDFFLHRNKGHYGTGANAKVLKESAPLYPVRPDVTKLVRGTEDAMTGIVWVDDNNNHLIYARKLFCEGYVLKDDPGEYAEITVYEHLHTTVGERDAALQERLALT